MTVYNPIDKLKQLAISIGKAESDITTDYLLSQQFAVDLDMQDELAKYRDEFHIPRVDLESDPIDNQAMKPCIYLCGNSLGLQPKRVQKYMDEELKKWRTAGVEGHFNGERPWAKIDEFSTPFCANIVGAKSSDDVVVMNTLSTNLHLLLISFYRPTSTRNKIFIEHGAFCSDYHVVKSQIMLHGYDPEECLVSLKPRSNETFLRTEDIIGFIEKEGDSIATVLFPGVQFYTGQAFDMKAITEAGHKKGCRVGFDLAHAVGNLQLDLDNWNVDFATWCSYKYLNSGPGCISGAFVHPNHKDANLTELPRLTGWWGQTPETRFQMKDTWSGLSGAQSWQLSNPSVTSIVCLQASIEVMCDAGMSNLRQKSIRLTGYLEALTSIICSVVSKEDGNLNIDNKSIIQLTPRDANARGCQISFLFPYNVEGINSSLLRQGVVCDVRKPDVIRIAPTPIYNSFNDVFQFTHLLQDISSSQ